MDVPVNASTCVCDSCSERGCALDFTGIASQVHVLSMDSLKTLLRHQGDICDCAVLWKEQQSIAAIELKGGKSNVDVAKAVSQLQQGLDLLNQLLMDQPVGEFFPILLYDAKRDPTKALAGRLVEFRGEKRRIIPEPCGEKLTQILKNLYRSRKQRKLRRQISRRSVGRTV